MTIFCFLLLAVQGGTNVCLKYISVKTFIEIPVNCYALEIRKSFPNRC